MTLPPSRRDDLQADIRRRTGIDETMIERLIHAFYDKVRSDALLGPFFAARIAPTEWPAHLKTMVAFWSSVTLMTGRYHGRPMQAHEGLPIDAVHFDRWLALFRATAIEVGPPPAAAHVIERAERIAVSLEAGIESVQGRSLGRPGTFRLPSRVALPPHDEPSSGRTRST